MFENLGVQVQAHLDRIYADIDPAVTPIAAATRDRVGDAALVQIVDALVHAVADLEKRIGERDT